MHHTTEAPEFELTPLQKEVAIRDQIEGILDLARFMPSAAARERYAKGFAEFTRWADEQGLPYLPAHGHVAAAWLLDLVFAGASEAEVLAAASSIKFAHDSARHYLDCRPIVAAIDCARDYLDTMGHHAAVHPAHLAEQDAAFYACASSTIH